MLSEEIRLKKQPWSTRAISVCPKVRTSKPFLQSNNLAKDCLCFGYEAFEAA